jgi:hypothetical protein
MNIKLEVCTSWLDLTHMHLEEVVYTAYGWHSNLSEEQILETLFALNLERNESET